VTWAKTRDELEVIKKTVPPLYLFHFIADFISAKAAAAARGGTYNVILVFDLLHTFLAAWVVFALEYWALFRMDPGTFRGTEGTGLLQFVEYSLTVLTSSSVSPIAAAALGARWIANAEIMSMVIWGFIVAFAILTARRDAYREGLAKFTDEIRAAVSAIEHRIAVVYQLSAQALEELLARNHGEMVNMLRKTRGLPSLPTQKKELAGQR
jgi:hypothetical protein